jgi:hypothetical protein
MAYELADGQTAEISDDGTALRAEGLNNGSGRQKTNIVLVPKEECFVFFNCLVCPETRQGRKSRPCRSGRGNGALTGSSRRLVVSCFGNSRGPRAGEGGAAKTRAGRPEGQGPSGRGYCLPTWKSHGWAGRSSPAVRSAAAGTASRMAYASWAGHCCLVPSRKYRVLCADYGDSGGSWFLRLKRGRICAIKVP